MAKPASTKSNKTTLKNASVKKSVKATAKERGFAKDKASRKEMKQQDVFYNKAGKQDLKSGQVTGASKANVSKSQSPSKPKVSVKPRGGMRGGASLGGGGGLNKANR
jgi:endo-1,4-beta-D-glucanase Y